MTVTLKWPASCRVITQKYGVKNSSYAKGYHTGIDMGCINGSPVYAAHDGTVTSAGYAGAYGNRIVLSAGGGFATSYNHLSRIAVSNGDTVSAGKLIGYLGTTGNSTGPHLHFEVLINGNDVDPAPYLSGAKSVTPASDATQAGSVFSIPGEITGVFSWMTDTTNWLRIGMVIAGAVLILMTFVGVAKASSMGKSAVSGITKAVKGSAKS